MDTSTTIDPTDRAAFEARALAGLRSLGVDPHEAHSRFEALYPATPEGALWEASHRGYQLERGDLWDFLRHRFGGPVDPDEVAWPRWLVDALLTWAREQRPDRSGPPRPRATSAADCLAWLRDDSPALRRLGGSMLAVSLGAGLALAGETSEDFEFLIAPQLSVLLGRAMAGDSDAIDDLEATITTKMEGPRWPD